MKINSFLTTKRLAAFALAGWLAADLSLLAQGDGSGPAISVPKNLPADPAHALPKPNWIDQSQLEADRKSRGCIECHAGVEPMHASKNVVIGCTDCHGGDAVPGLTQRQAHVAPRNPVFWESSANPNDSSVLLNHESPEFIQFVNPGDLRVVEKTCAPCHADIVHDVSHSMMRHGAMLWGAALYNNGAYPAKNYRFGQDYGADGVPLRLESPIPVTQTMTDKYGILPFLDPLPRFDISQPGNVLRIFERGGEEQSQLGNPNPFEEPGKPARRLSDRGLGTLLRTDPVFLNLQKTRLNDPLLDFMGSNNHPGDYRSSGCTACHVVYANDRSPTDSGWYAKYGNQGLSFSADKAIRKDERGHPITHQFTRAIPTEQCMTCHMHQGNLFVNPYLGYTWWDQETDGEFMYPKQQKNPTPEELVKSIRDNPEAAAARGLWGDLDFLEKVSELNPKLTNTQFADYHGHGWIFRAVFKHDREGNLRDRDENIIAPDDPQKFAKAVHLKDEHLAHGMQCVDCHFDADAHGNGLLYGEPRAATTIECIDCHGTINARPTLITSGNGGIWDGTQVTNVDLRAGNTPSGPRFFWQGNKLFQRSMMSPDLIWEIPQTIDTIDPKSSHYNAKSAYAKTLRRDGTTWGDVPPKSVCPRDLAHDNGNISCQICHSSWATSCYGCHLPMKANQRVPLNKFEGVTDRNFTSYNPQVIRDDAFQLGVDATYKGNRLAVLRSSSAVVVSSQNANREWVYSQQQTISADGYSGQAYNPHFPHTTSGVGTTKNCEDCHIAKSNDNNAWLASLLGFGTGTVNFFGRYAYVGEGKGGLDAVVWTEQDEPQAAFGSHLQRLAYPDNYKKHAEENHGVLQEAEHKDAHEILDLQLRGEYLYTANGADGFEVFDVANIDQKGFSEKISTAPVSPLGQRTYVRTKYATSVTLPSTLGIDPLRTQQPENEEQPVSPIYAWVFVTDREEGLVMATVGTLLDGDPDNNFFDREKIIRFNPDGKLTGAMHSFMAGTNLYVVGKNGLFVVGLNNTKLVEPTLAGELTDGLKNPRAVGVQFRYAFVTDDEGFKVLDVTEPTKPKLIPGAFVPLKNAQRFYLARTYAYVADGADGLAFIDISNPEKPKLEQLYNAEGKLTDTRAVQIGSVSASEFALVADGKNGLQILQLISPENVPESAGFSPKPNPKWIAGFPTKSPAVAVSRGLDRDLVVDESGNQTVVFGRRGSRPFNLEEMKKFYERDGSLYTVENVFARDGKLVTESGEELKPAVEFQSAETETNSPPPDNERLMRRGQ
ncbi:MAG TPA: hypothetical protein VHX90_03445 [Verrucomicrobiae bacterium]|nr:hypothetical protein [Verrucomicrobiae bacterium]